MGRRPCCSKEGLNRGAWTATEDKLLKDYITLHGKGNWRNLPQRAGLLRCGKSCRLRWLNYLRPDITVGNISNDEEELIIRLHKLLGNRWSLIARRLPGRTDNEIKNYWNTHVRKKLANPQNPKQSSNHHNQEKEISKSNEKEPRPKKESSNVIRTKAVRCSSKVFISTPQTNKKTDQPMADTNMISMDKPLDLIVQEENNNSTDLALVEYKGDFDSDANGYVWLSEFLNSEELLMISNEDKMEDWGGNNFLDHPNSNPNDSTSFLEYGDDWLWLPEN